LVPGVVASASKAVARRAAPVKRSRDHAQSARPVEDGAGLHDDWPDLALYPAWIPVHVPDATYDVRTVKAELRSTVGGEKKLFLWFEIIGGEHAGKRLPFICCLPEPGHQVSPASNYWAAWVRANGGRPPGRHDRMSPRIFRNRLLHIRTRTVTTDNRRRAKPHDQWYSVIDEILPIVDGLPASSSANGDRQALVPPDESL
jgi:hypothetical protein